MNEYAGLTSALEAVLWAQGGVLLVIGLLYLASSSADLGDVSPAGRRRIARFIGLAFVWLSVGQLVGGWTGGLASFVRERDVPLLGYLVLCTRSLSLFYLLKMVWESLERWRRQSPETA